MGPGAQPAAGDDEVFAWFYRKHWCDRYRPWALAVLDSILPQHLDRGASVVELCCGGGTLTQALASRGYYVTGVDRSPVMVAFARQEAPDAFFLECDLRAFRMPLAFNGAVCAYSSLNHLSDPRDLRSVFDNVCASLLPRGAFVFDLNLEQAYNGRWCGTCAEVEKDSAVVVQGSYDRIERLGRTEITMFREIDGQWRRFDTAVVERCYDPAEIRRMLIEAGFATASVVDASRDLGIVGAAGEGRAFFVAVKPSAATRLRAKRSSIPLRSRAASRAQRRKAIPVPPSGETR